MEQLELSTGTIDYLDTGGEGPVVLLLHGLLMDASLWDDVVADLSADHRCIAPTLPLGAHRHALHPDADVSLPSIARLIPELIDRLGLTDVTLVGNDTGGALAQLVISEDAPHIGRVVLGSCEAFDNIPPGATGKTVALVGKLPPRLFGLFMQQMRMKPLRRLPLAFGWLTKRGDAHSARWIRPMLKQPEIRRDTVRILRAVMSDKDILVKTAEQLPNFKRPALVVWASEDRVMPPEHGRRLARLLPDSRLVEIGDSYTLLALDQPVKFAQAIREFVTAEH